MSFIWDAVDQRQKQKLEADRQLKDFLVQQQDELKKRQVQAASLLKN